MSNEGKLILFSGPSGVGKDTLLDILFQKRPDFQKSISITTRERREGEVNGVDYYFITPDDFEAMLDNGEVLEFAKYGKNLYGTPKKPVDGWLAEGKTVILKIEVQGAEKIKKMYPDAVAIFVMPPSMEVLEKRLRRLCQGLHLPARLPGVCVREEAGRPAGEQEAHCVRRGRTQ